MPQDLLHSMRIPNFIGRLPDIPEIGQTNQYFVATFNDVTQIHQIEADELLQSGQYVFLPHEPSSDFWRYTKAPWWEFAVVLDQYDGFIKAPARPRPNEPSAQEADEKIDQYPENQGKIQVVAPSTLDTWANYPKQFSQGVREDYIERLKRI